VFNALKPWLDAHVHSGVLAGPVSSGPPVIASPAPTSTAATKVKAK